MSSYQFGIGRGHLGKAAEKAARQHGARLVNHTKAGCGCGHGCPPYRECPAQKMHWFATANYGEPFNSRTAREVLEAVEQAEKAARARLAKKGRR